MSQAKRVFLSVAILSIAIVLAVPAQAGPPFATLGGEVTGPILATVVTAAVSTDTPNGIVRRDAAGGFIAGSISLDGNLLLLPSSATAGNVYKGGFLFLSTAGFQNLFLGVNAGNLTVTGSNNAAFGLGALGALTSGLFNTAVGQGALPANTSGLNNTAVGTNTLANNTTGAENVAIGVSALSSNTIGLNNIAIGDASLVSVQTSDGNVAVGGFSGNQLTSGSFNTLLGYNTMQQATSGNNNVAIGANAGSALTNGAFNVYIASTGVPVESATLRIAAGVTNAYIGGINGVIVPAGQPVFIDASGHLGTGLASSARFKTDIQEVEASADRVMELNPVSFRYLPQYDPAGATQYGLVAEEVAKVAPELVFCDKSGQVSGVNYQAVDVLMLREVQKQRQAIDTLREQNASLRRATEVQQRQIEELIGALKDLKHDGAHTTSSN